MDFLCKLDLHSEYFCIVKCKVTTAAYTDVSTEANFWTTNSTLADVQMQCQKWFVQSSEE